MIPVTKPFLPPLKDYIALVEKIWKNEQLTNAGPLVQELEAKLKDYLQAQNCFFLSNGTIALQIAIKALNLEGEIITTPFSYVATTSAISWEGCVPVFVDIEAQTLTIDPSKIESAITDTTTAILVTHVYGIPCDIERIEKIANKHNLKVIYDAAHCFGVRYNGKPLVNYGDISTLSFHATKLFQTIEGGAIICNNQEITQKVSYMRNFGHDGPERFFGIGINGKNSEFHAAMGLCNLPYISQIIAKRKYISNLYDSFFQEEKRLSRPVIRLGTEYNYSYYPILFENENILYKIQKALNQENIFPRRYFYPSLSTLNYVKPNEVPIALDVSKRVLCLPLYYTISAQEIERICIIVLKNL